MNFWPKDRTADLIRFYGDPRGANGLVGKVWEIHSLERVPIPWKAVAAWDHNTIVRTAYVHSKIANTLEKVFAKIWADCNHDQKTLEETGMHLYGGAFNYRVKRGLASLSVHAFGAALDFDPERNGLGNRHGYMPRSVVDAFEAEGAVWGGNFKSRPDPMHFQFATI